MHEFPLSHHATGVIDQDSDTASQAAVNTSFADERCRLLAGRRSTRDELLDQRRNIIIAAGLRIDEDRETKQDEHGRDR